LGVVYDDAANTAHIMIQLCVARVPAAAIHGTNAKVAASTHAAGATAIAADAGRAYEHGRVEWISATVDI